MHCATVLYIKCFWVNFSPKGFIDETYVPYSLYNINFGKNSGHVLKVLIFLRCRFNLRMENLSLIFIPKPFYSKMYKLY